MTSEAIRNEIYIPLPSPIRWEICEGDFTPDGALRDIYIHDTTIEHWQALLELLRSTYEPEYLIDGEPRPLPASAGEIFAIHNQASTTLRFRVGGITIISHFFTTDEIEFDIDPIEIRSQESLDALLSFLRRIGDTLGTEAVITWENEHTRPFLTYDPRAALFRHH
jgi:hypothetical protein